jgi:hypothetical protein
LPPVERRLCQWSREIPMVQAVKKTNLLVKSLFQVSNYYYNFR